MANHVLATTLCIFNTVFVPFLYFSNLHVCFNHSTLPAAFLIIPNILPNQLCLLLLWGVLILPWNGVDIDPDSSHISVLILHNSIPIVKLFKFDNFQYLFLFNLRHISPWGPGRKNNKLRITPELLSQ